MMGEGHWLAEVNRLQKKWAEEHHKRLDVLREKSLYERLFWYTLALGCTGWVLLLIKSLTT